MKKHYRLHDLADALLYRFYVDYVEDVRKSVPSFELRVLFDFPVSSNLLETAGTHLSGKQWLLNVTAPQNPTYKISTQGILYVEEQLKKRDSVISKFKLYGEPAITIAGHSLSSDLKDETERTRADKWEPLPIERETPKYKEAVDALDKTIETVKADNGYATTYPEERDSILWTLGAGVNAIREGTVTRQQIRDLLIAPLKYLSNKFADAIMGESAKTALAKVIAWLGWGG